MSFAVSEARGATLCFCFREAPPPTTMRSVLLEAAPCEAPVGSDFAPVLFPSFSGRRDHGDANGVQKLRLFRLFLILSR